MDLHRNQKDEGQANENCEATMNSFESEGDNHIAQSDSRPREGTPRKVPHHEHSIFHV